MLKVLYVGYKSSSQVHLWKCKRKKWINKNKKYQCLYFPECQVFKWFVSLHADVECGQWCGVRREEGQEGGGIPPVRGLPLYPHQLSPSAEKSEKNQAFFENFEIFALEFLLYQKCILPQCPHKKKKKKKVTKFKCFKMWCFCRSSVVDL